MRLTKSADFAMRILICLAQENGPLTMPVLADRLQISYHHLSKLVQKLRKAQVLHTLQGKNGGVSLLSTPQEISLRQIIDLIDGPTALAECLDQEGECAFSCDCKLKVALSGVQKKINGLLDDIHIVDVM